MATAPHRPLPCLSGSTGTAASGLTVEQERDRLQTRRRLLSKTYEPALAALRRGHPRSGLHLDRRHRGLPDDLPESSAPDLGPGASPTTALTLAMPRRLLIGYEISADTDTG